jgi:spore maturation protein CgeB
LNITKIILGGNLNIIFVAVFDNNGKSSNNSQAVGLEKLGHNVIRYNYRHRANIVGIFNRDKEIIELCRNTGPDAIIFAKTNTVGINVFEECKKICKVCYWFPDPLQTYENREFFAMTEISNLFCCDKKNVMIKAKNNFNKNSHIVFDGYDPELEFPKNIEKDIDVSFIGNLYGDRLEKIKKLNYPCAIIQNAFGEQHSEFVSRSRINLNFCTSYGASDRTYKVLAAGGFYLTDDWDGREEFFVDGEHIVVYKDINDLNEKIDYYLRHPIEREKIARSGREKVAAFSRYAWAEKISNLLKST